MNLDQLPDLLRHQRWYAAKGRPISGITLREMFPLLDAGSLALVNIHFGSQEPLLSQPRSQEPSPPGRGQGEGVSASETYVLPIIDGPLKDGLLDGRLRSALYERFLNSESIPGENGTLSWQAYDLPAFDAGTSELLGFEQSNSSIRYGDSLVLKVYRRLTAGVSRDLEVGRFLSELDFPHTPSFYGAITYRDASMEATVAVLEGWVPNQGDGWTYVLDRLKGSAGHSLIADIKELGRITGEMHNALASRSWPECFAPAMATARDRETWLADLNRQIDAAFAHPNVSALLGRRERYAAIEQTFKGMAVPYELQLIQIHGDYHLGQVLKTEDGFSIIDFEGEPARPIEERRLRQPALRDVAGMLRSLHYAACTAYGRGEASPARLWAQRAGEAFLDGWLSSASGGGLVPAKVELMREYLTLFQLAKAFYELNYEIRNRPDWVSVPVAGIEALTEHLQ